MNQRGIQELVRNIKSGNKKLAIYGIGFVGTAIASTWLRAGASVIAVDKISKLVKEINNKNITNGNYSFHSEPKAKEAFNNAINQKRLIATLNGKWASKKSDIKIVAVPVGLNKRSVDLRFLYSAIEDIIKGLKKNDIIIVTPTVPIGTSTKIIRFIEQKTKLKSERDFFFIYSPERISAGQAIADIENNYPPILSGGGKKSVLIASKMFELISSKKPIIMSCTEAAEAEIRQGGEYQAAIVTVRQLREIRGRHRLSRLGPKGPSAWPSPRAPSPATGFRDSVSGSGTGRFACPVGSNAP